MPDYAQIYQAAQSMFEQPSRPAVPLKQAQNIAMPPARASSGAIVPGSGGLRLKGDPNIDAIIIKMFTEYAQGWGRKFVELKRQFPNISNAEVERQIGPPPSQVTSYSQFIDRVGQVASDPAEQEHKMRMEQMREQFKLNEQLLGRQDAINRAAAALQHQYALEIAGLEAEARATESEKGREFQRALAQAQAGLTREEIALRKQQMEQSKEMSERELAISEAESKARTAKTKKETEQIGKEQPAEDAYEGLLTLVADIKSANAEKRADIMVQLVSQGMADDAQAIAAAIDDTASLAPYKLLAQYYYKQGKITKQQFMELFGEEPKEAEAVDAAKNDTAPPPPPPATTQANVIVEDEKSALAAKYKNKPPATTQANVIVEDEKSALAAKYKNKPQLADVMWNF